MKPNTRKEAFLMKHMGFDVETPEPATREEMIMANAPGGGGGGGGDEYIVHLTFDDDDNFVCDKTFAEIEAAITEQGNGGKLVILKYYNSTLMFTDSATGKNAKFCGMEFAPPNCIMRTTVTFLKDGTIEETNEFANLSSLFTE